jgi:oxygen-independent coproporphyrinogen-3 oxidase
LIDDGLMTMEDDWISVTPRGRLLVRNICMVFDRYLAQPTTARYSRTI